MTAFIGSLGSRNCVGVSYRNGVKKLSYAGRFQYHREIKRVRCCVEGEIEKRDFMRTTAQALDHATNLFPLWVFSSAMVGVAAPQTILWFQGGWVFWTLSLIMLGMGLTLPVDEFVEALKTPQKVILGAAAQFAIMPFLGLTIANGLQLPTPYLLGLVLVSTCPGGTASNLVCLLCGANVSLSVLMTTATTLLSVFMTPFLLKVLVGQVVPINAAALMLSTAQIVFLPLVVGVFMQRFIPKLVKAVEVFLPFSSVLGVSAICSSIVAMNRDMLLTSGPKLLFGVILLHLFGFLLGYLFGRTAGFTEKDSRTVSIEVGMQNSGLGAVLAQLHFANPLTSVPSAISATTHSILGSTLSAFWRLADRRKQKLAEERENRSGVPTTT
eukprot:CAMPEP_0184743262 /NCGR_PEP_ID=MMETSP0315-20130426/6127_1 /TAXON_ID=101924 /ORGANISM="Rhodosorus marinus, Strain UTEX LB 2760" /LENGTH=382 /DNA_ID=CAMNT_0027214425 /DNA_START=71 /DNA_END=1219 /DNA_ORIENTATION=+